MSIAGISHKGNETNILKRSIDNSKFGKQKVWRAGGFKGMPLFSLTLEERATCPNSCQQWDQCYGNHMPFATRFKPGKKLETRLTYELGKLSFKFPKGYSLRLHILGDFYSVKYVQFWAIMLAELPNLHIYGYTHTQGKIKAEIDKLFKVNPKRFVILQSDADPLHETRPVAIVSNDPNPNLVYCPDQANQLDGCLSCGLCTLPYFKGVRFSEH